VSVAEVSVVAVSVVAVSVGPVPVVSVADVSVWLVHVSHDGGGGGGGFVSVFVVPVVSVCGFDCAATEMRPATSNAVVIKKLARKRCISTSSPR
jgi:hypothetical protein